MRISNLPYLPSILRLEEVMDRKAERRSSALARRVTNALLFELRQFAAYGRNRAQLQKKKLLRRQRFLLLFRISDLDEDIKIDDRLEEGQPFSFKSPDFPQRRK